MINGVANQGPGRKDWCHLKRYDHIIVGAGSAGCVLAHRLSADPRRRVLLLEAGGPDTNPFIHIPAGLAQLVRNPRIDWDYHTDPVPGLDGRRLWWPRGRVLGGSSSMNAMCYVRGQAEDYDHWNQVAPGWSYRDVLPAFRKAEDQAHGADAYHGVGGPLTVSDLRFTNELSAAFIEAGVTLGLSRTADFNGAQQAGIGYYQVTQRRGRRASTARAYLAPAMARPNLTVRTGVLVTRVLIQYGRATGVELSANGATERIAAEAVTLCGGAINSPQLLMLSGIGPASDLETLGIDVVANLPGVGANLHDHLDYTIVVRSKKPITYDFNQWQQLQAAVRYLLTRSGPASSNIAEAGAFVASSLATDRRPDLQYHFAPVQLDNHGRNRLPGHGYSIHCTPLRPLSHGRLTLSSRDPGTAPNLQPNYLSDPRDLPLLIEAVRTGRRIAAATPFEPYRGAEIYPGPDTQDTERLAAAIRRKAETLYHPVGTCRMGLDPGAVVDPTLAVHGVAGLRVVDAAVMPSIPSGNTNAPTIMIAERAADWLAD